MRIEPTNELFPGSPEICFTKKSQSLLKRTLQTHPGNSSNSAKKLVYIWCIFCAMWALSTKKCRFHHEPNPTLAIAPSHRQPTPTGKSKESGQLGYNSCAMRLAASDSHLEDHPSGCKWLVIMVSKSPNWGCFPSKWPKWLINGGC